MGLPSYIINFDELSDMLQNYLENKIEVSIGDAVLSTKELERLLEEVKQAIPDIDYDTLIEALNLVGDKLDNLAGSIGIVGTQKFYGENLSIPALNDKFEINFKVPNDGKLTGVTFSLSSFNLQDTIDLYINDIQVFMGVRTKNYGETKYFNTFHNIKKDSNIKLIFNNESATNKVLWVDFNILED